MRSKNLRTKRRIRRLSLLIVSVATLAMAAIATIGVVGAAVNQNATTGLYPGKTVQGQHPIVGHKGNATCGEPGQPACPPVPNDSVIISSESPSAVLAALPSIPGYMSPVQAYPAAPPNSTYSFDMPVLVLPATTGELPHYIVRAAVNGVRMITYDLTYNPATRALHFVSVGGNEPNDPHYNKPFPWVGVSAATAAATLSSSRGLAISTGTQPQLVFFDLNPQAVNPAHPLKWFGGGESPADPIWRLKGSDGHLYFVGIDGHLYLSAELPVKAGAAFVQP